MGRFLWARGDRRKLAQPNVEFSAGGRHSRPAWGWPLLPLTALGTLVPSSALTPRTIRRLLPEKKEKFHRGKPGSPSKQFRGWAWRLAFWRLHFAEGSGAHQLTFEGKAKIPDRASKFGLTAPGGSRPEIAFGLRLAKVKIPWGKTFSGLADGLGQRDSGPVATSAPGQELDSPSTGTGDPFPGAIVLSLGLSSG